MSNSMSNKIISRLGILQIQDPDGLADEYIFYLLDNLRETVTQLVLVCNGRFKDNEYPRLKRHADAVFSLDPAIPYAEAFQTVLESLLGWEKACTFDELVLLDDSFYGPLYPFKTMFDQMEKRSGTDFWGITAQSTQTDRWLLQDENTMPYYLDSCFLVFRKRLFHHASFRTFWDTFHTAENCLHPALDYVSRLTCDLTKAGFRCDSYVNAPEFISERVLNNYRYTLWNSYELIAKHGCPIVLRDVFLPNPRPFALAGGENPARTLAYIAQHTQYDVDLIWRHLIRICNATDLHETFHLNYILPFQTKISQCNSLQGKKIAVFAHMFYPERIDDCLDYVEQIPESIDIYITTSSEERKNRITAQLRKRHVSKCRIVLTENKGREIGSLLVGCRDILPRYDYVGFVHDKRTIRDDGPQAIGRSFMYLVWENLLKSPEYIENVFQKFDENPRLGLLAPPNPYHSYYFGIKGNEWTACFQKTRLLAKSLHLNCDLSKDKPPFILSTSFWCRTAALKPLFEHPFRYEDFPPEPLKPDGTLNHAIERILPYVAQHAGYFSGNVMNEEYASLQSVSYDRMLSGIMNEYRQRNVITDYAGCLSDFQSERLIRFCNRHPHVYICCVDAMGKAYGDVVLRNQAPLEGFIVPEGIPRGTIAGHPICYLSEIDYPPSDCGFVLALSFQNQASILPVLRQNGFIHTYSDIR